MKIDRNELDRHITGNYGEDQFSNDDEHECDWEIVEGMGIVCKCGENLNHQQGAAILNEHAKLLQAVNDKDQELFESQELVAELREACQYALRETVQPSSDPLIKALKAAIRKAKIK